MHFDPKCNRRTNNDRIDSIWDDKKKLLVQIVLAWNYVLASSGQRSSAHFHEIKSINYIGKMLVLSEHEMTLDKHPETIDKRECTRTIF